MMKQINKITLALIIVSMWNYVACQYVDVINNKVWVTDFINSILFNPQKVLFNNMLCIMMCVYANTFDVNRVEYVIRDKKIFCLINYY